MRFWTSCTFGSSPPEKLGPPKIVPRGTFPGSSFAAISDVCLTDNPRLMIRRHSDITIRRSSKLARIFPCPSSSFPSRMLVWTAAGRFNIRSVFATADRLFPSRTATCSCVNPNSSISRR